MSWLSRLKNALNPRRLDEDLGDEFRDHLERRAAALHATGLGREEAQRQARARFGNVTRLREQSRTFRLWNWLDTTVQDARYGWRGMCKAPVFATTAVLSLGLAIGANTATYSIVDAAMLRPLPVYKPDRLFTLSWPEPEDPGTPSGTERNSFSYPEFLRFVDATKSVARLGFSSGPFRTEMTTLKPDAPIEKINRAWISGQSFDILGVRPIIGRLFSKEEDRVPQGRALAVISYDFWQRRFQRDPHILGQRVSMDGQEVEIIGVAQEGFWGVEPGKFVDVWVPGSLHDPRILTNPGAYWLQIIGRFAPGTSPEQIEARLQPPFHDFQGQLMKLFPAMPEGIKKQFLESKIRVHSAARGISGMYDFQKTFSRPLWIVFSVAAGIFLIACANIASLLLARSTARATEMAMRVALGAGRMRLVRQMLTESLILSFAAGALGWSLARSIGPLLVHLLSTNNNPVQFVLSLDSRVLFFCTAVSALSAVLFGLAPAWQASSTQPVRSLRASPGQVSKLRLGKSFVSVQVACAFCLVAVGAAFLFSLGNLLRVNPGFDAENVAVLSLTTEAAKQGRNSVMWLDSHEPAQVRLRNQMFELQQAVASQRGIQSAAMAWWLNFGGGGWMEQIFVPGKGPSKTEELLFPVSTDYFATLRIPLLAGRDFMRSDDSAGQPVPAIVNEAFARKYFNSINVLGREFSYISRMNNSRAREMIVGIVADTRYYSLRTAAAPIVYLPINGNTAFTLYVRSTLPLGQIMRIVGPQADRIGAGMQIHEITTLETIVGNTLLREKLLAGIAGAFALVGLLLAAIGLFGLLNYAVGRRTKEIGIRIALGARRAQVFALVLKDVAALTGAGMVAGLAGTLAILAIVKSLLFGIKTADPFVTGAAIGVLIGTGFLAASLPAYRAATVDPTRALREE